MLGFLKALEEEIGALRGAFDLTIRTSAGKCNHEFVKFGHKLLLDVDAFRFTRCAQCHGDNGLQIIRERGPQEVQVYGTENFPPNTPYADDAGAIFESGQNMDHRQPL
jgi:hypothetical protein